MAARSPGPFGLFHGDAPRLALADRTHRGVTAIGASAAHEGPAIIGAQRGSFAGDRGPPAAPRRAPQRSWANAGW